MKNEKTTAPDYELPRRLELLHPIRCQQPCEICEAATALRAMMQREQTAIKLVQTARRLIEPYIDKDGSWGDVQERRDLKTLDAGLDAFLSDAAAEPSKGKADE